MTAPTAQPAAPRSIPDLLRRAASARPDGSAVVDGSLRWTWSQLRDEVSAMAGGLAAAGLAPGDRLALQAATSADFLVTYIAALQAGLIVVPVNPAYTVAELGHILDDSGARLLVTSSVASIEAAGDLLAEHARLERVVVASRVGTAGLAGLDELVAAGGETVQADRTGEDVAVLLYTSGTSGRPKAAMLSVRALLANLAQLGALRPTPVSAEDRVFLPLPLFHVFGLNAGVGLALWFGAAMVLASRFDAQESLRVIRDERVSVLVGAPLEFAVWAAQPDFAESMSGVRLGLSGSAPLLPDLVNRYADVGVALFEGYGLTEAAPVVTLNLVPAAAGPGWLDPKPGSIGRPLPGIEVRLMDADDEEVEPGDLGVLETRGANLFSGYWPDGAGGPDADGWFVTGDLAVADDDGDYYLVGRRSDLVLVNGFNVYPAEVEAVFRRLPGVQEVAVLGEPETETTEAVVCYVVPQPGAVLDPDDLRNQAARSLARFKLPKRIVEVDSLPHTATGKVMKWRLRTATGGL